MTNQTKALAKVNNFIRDKSLPSEDQADIRLKCLRHWQVPDNMVQPERALYAPDYYNAFIKGDSPPNLGWVPKPMPAEGYITMTREKDPPRMTATQDWACVHLTCRPDSLGFFMSNRGRNCFVHRLFFFLMPAFTLLLLIRLGYVEARLHSRLYLIGVVREASKVGPHRQFEASAVDLPFR